MPIAEFPRDTSQKLDNIVHLTWLRVKAQAELRTWGKRFDPNR